MAHKASHPEIIYLAAAATASATSAAVTVGGVAAVAVKEDNSYNDKPYPIVVKKIAKAVIHKIHPFEY